MEEKLVLRELEWAYPLRWDEIKEVSTDILILGGGIAGCWAAIAAEGLPLKN